MTYDEFVARVCDHGQIDRNEADKAIGATLSTLAERLAGGEADDLAAQLPDEIAGHMRGAEGAGEGRPLSVDDFVATVAEREGRAGEAEARERARAVLVTVREAVTGGEFDDVLQQLPDDYRNLVG